MGRLSRAAAALALAAIPVLGAVAVHSGGALADGGVIHSNTVGTGTNMRILADNGVIENHN